MLNCRPGKVHADGFFDYCKTCEDHMMRGEAEGKKIRELEERLYSYETRILYNEKETYRHENDKHVYLMIAMQYNNGNENQYYDF